MSLTSYTDLLQAVGDYVVYDDVNAYATTIIEMAQSVMNRDVRIREMQATQSISAQSTQTFSLPADFIETIDLYETGEQGGTLELMSPKAFWSAQTSRSGSGRPKFYTVIGETVYLSPSPDGPRDYVLHYYQKVLAVSSANPTNVIYANHPDMYLYCVLMHAFQLVGDMGRFEEFKAAYDRARMSVTQADSRARHRPQKQVRSQGVTRDGVFRIA